jgi:NAD(P)-dependent dehydrogenase (short-subunit alcohol dehydrogenase family)
VVDQIQAVGRGSAVFLPADFSSLADGATAGQCCAPDLQSSRYSYNAGIGSGGSTAKRETSQDGYELRFAVNYLAGFLLTRLLLPLMMASKPARIVNVSSLGQPPIDFDDVMLSDGYTGGRAYAQSKLAQIMFTFDLARELDPATATANCLHPATYMATTMVRQSGVARARFGGGGGGHGFGGGGFHAGGFGDGGRAGFAGRSRSDARPLQKQGADELRGRKPKRLFY